MALKKIEFTAKNVKPFSSWLQRFVSIDTALLIEIDEENSEFLAKTYNEERSAVKFSRIKFDVAGFVVVPSKTPKRIKVGLYNIAKLMKIMDQFSDAEFSFVVNYDELVDTNELVGDSIILKNKNLKMTVECTSLNIFKYISDDLFKNTIAHLDDNPVNFKLSAAKIDQVNSLCKLDNESKFVEFKNDDEIFIAGKTFDLLIDKSDSTSKASINIFKDQFASVDVENYDVQMGDDRLVFTAENSSSFIVLSAVEKE